jgi:hypothetical protein
MPLAWTTQILSRSQNSVPASPVRLTRSGWALIPPERVAVIGEHDQHLRIERHVQGGSGCAHPCNDRHAKTVPAIGFDAQEQPAWFTLEVITG